MYLWTENPYSVTQIWWSWWWCSPPIVSFSIGNIAIDTSEVLVSHNTTLRVYCRHLVWEPRLSLMGQKPLCHHKKCVLAGPIFEGHCSTQYWSEGHSNAREMRWSSLGNAILIQARSKDDHRHKEWNTNTVSVFLPEILLLPCHIFSVSTGYCTAGMLSNGYDAPYCLCSAMIRYALQGEHQ